MKKIFMVLTLFVMVVALFACDKDTPTPDPVDPTPVDPTPVDPTPPTVQLTYLAHNLGTEADNNVERQLVSAFMVKYPHIKVTILERPKIPNPENPGEELDQDWNEFLTSRAAINKFPDVFTWFSSGAEAASKGWAYDLKNVVNADNDFKNLPDAIKEAGQYKGAQYALVTSQYNYGYVVNQSLIEDYIGDEYTLRYGMTYTQLLALCQNFYNATSVAAPEAGLMSIDGVSSEWYNWLPTAYNNELGYNAYDAAMGGFQYNSQAFKDAMTEIVKIQANPWALQNMEGELFNEGKVMAHYVNTAELKAMMDATKDPEHALYGKKIDFVGLPYVNGKSYVPSIIDLICVGKSTKHPQEAYLLTKWMTYGLDGYTKRVELSGGSLAFAPLIDNAEGTLFSSYSAGFSILPEYTKFLTQHENFIPEGGKVVPGYWAARQPIFGEISSRPGNVNSNVGDLMWDASHGLLANWIDYTRNAQDLCVAALLEQQRLIDEEIAKY